MKKLILAAPAVLALAACGTPSPPAQTAALLTSGQALSCQAYMSKTAPADNTTTLVHVRTQPSAKVFAVAFYKTVDRAYYALAGRDGRADIPYYIGGATLGRKVNVVVTVVQGSKAARCATSFTPREAASSSSSPARGSTTSSVACHPLDSEGTCYRAGEYCPDADHGMAGVAQNGEAITCENNNGWRWEPA